MATKRNRPDKDGKDRKLFDFYKAKIKAMGAPCAICGLPINYELKYPNPWSYTLDHIIPINKGGVTREENMQPAHFKCNRTKGDKLYLDISDINKLRIAQGGPPLTQQGETIHSNIPFGRQPLKESMDYKLIRFFEPNRNLPQSVDWRTY